MNRVDFEEPVTFNHGAFGSQPQRLLDTDCHRGGTIVNQLTTRPPLHLSFSVKYLICGMQKENVQTFQ